MLSAHFQMLCEIYDLDPFHTPKVTNVHLYYRFLSESTLITTMFQLFQPLIIAQHLMKHFVCQLNSSTNQPKSRYTYLLHLLQTVQRDVKPFRSVKSVIQSHADLLSLGYLCRTVCIWNVS